MGETCEKGRVPAKLFGAEIKAISWKSSCCLHSTEPSQYQACCCWDAQGVEARLGDAVGMVVQKMGMQRRCKEDALVTWPVPGFCWERRRNALQHACACVGLAALSVGYGGNQISRS